MSITTFEMKDIREDVRLNLPKDWKLNVFRVTSGDSGKKYWVQILRNDSHARTEIFDGTLITLCDCNEGQFQQPLSVLGLKICCKHAQWVLAYLKERGK